MSSGFVSQNDIEKEREDRQAEWEKVRKPDEPILAPEPEACNKSLFEQLKDNRDKKQAEFDEARAMRNMIRGVDEDESEFLAQVDQRKLDEARRRKQEEKEMLAALANNVIPAVEPVLLRPPPPAAKPAVNQQAKLVSSLIKRKSETSSEPVRAAKVPKEEMVDAKGASGEAKNQTPAVPSLLQYADYSDSESEGDPE